jgi:hypothetical protein
MGDDLKAKYQIVHRYLPDDKKTLEKEGKLQIVEDENDSTDDDTFFFEGEQTSKQDNELNINENFVDDI